MQEILNKYYKMSKEERDELEDICILNEIQNELKNRKIMISNAEKIMLLELVRKCYRRIDKNYNTTISRIFKVMNDKDITIMELNSLNSNKLFRLLLRENKKYQTEVLKTFRYGRYKCVLLKNEMGLILAYESDEGIQYMDRFKNTEEILIYVIKNKLLSRGENIV